jgi:TRAP-type C4-dicarboxylate transport system substrate-binding protein
LKTTRITVSAVLLICLCCLLAPGFTTTAAAVELRFTSHHPAADVQSKLLAAWMKEVTTRSHGEVTFKFYPGESRVSGPQTVNAIAGDYVDIGFSVLDYTRGLFPMMEVINLPLGYMDGKINTAIINEVYDRFQPAEFDKFKVIYFMAPGPHYLHTKDLPVHSKADLKGQKVHYNGLSDQLYEELGAIPVSLPMAKLNDAIYQNKVKGGVWDFSAGINFKFAEVVNYDIICNETAHTAMLYVLMNKDKWNSLPTDVKKIIDDIKPTWVAKHGTTWAQAEANGLALSKKNNSNIIELGPEAVKEWQAAAQVVIDTYITNMASEGLPGKDVVDFVTKRLNDARNGNFKSQYMD